MTATTPHRALATDTTERHHVDAPPRWTRWTRWSVHAALVWSVVTLTWALSWAAGLTQHPFHDASAVAMGAVLNAYDPAVGTVATLVVGLIGVVCAWVTRSVRRRGRPVGRIIVALAWTLAAIAGLVFVDGRFLAVLGYTMIVPVLAWTDPSLVGAYLDAVANPAEAFVLNGVIGGALWGSVAIAGRRSHRGACEDCGRGPHWSVEHEQALRCRALRIGRVAVTVGVIAAAVYPAVRLPWLFGISAGMSDASFAAMQAEPGMIETGVALALAGLVGAALMTGLVRDWGVRFPRWMIGLARRRVPVSLAVVPASVVACALVAIGRGIVPNLLAGTFAVGDLTLAPGAAAWLQVAGLVSFLPWGVALAVATAAYAIRRRGRCDTCQLGAPEAAVQQLS